MSLKSARGQVYLTALGQTTHVQYNALNQVSQLTDPKGNVSFFTYDANGNPLSLTDALNHSTGYTYDSMDRRSSRTDALVRTETISYDLNGNVASVTDRKGQHKAVTYDGLNRPVNVCFNQVVDAGTTSCESTVSYQYDLANNRVTITDSLTGTITKTFDNLGRLINETTPQGGVSYVYDLGSRLTSMTVAGQPPVTYAYDVGNRVTSITKAGQTVQFTYDIGSRRTSMTLPNGMVAAFSYDNSSRLTEISYSLNSTVIGNLTYTYDALNRRIGVGGSLAKTALPPTMSSATYDATNQLVNWNGAAFTYDANGRMVSDGQNTYAWNARGQLTGLSGAVTAAFAYDALGRRIGKTIGANNLGFAYDGGAITQELSGSQVTANIWNGGTSYFQRTDTNGSMVPLVDSLGSIVALADSTGTLQTQYAYEPFGATIASGAVSGNQFQYIGQENDQTGLYYFHARYYNPLLMRFISEDPIGFAGSDVNLHAYSLNSPTNLRDPNGTDPIDACWIGGLGNAAIQSGINLFHGRKTTLGNVWDYAVSGCETGVLMEVTGVNWALGKVIGVTFDFAAKQAAELFSKEVIDAAEAACGLCFPAGTPVRTRNGIVPIEKIKVGDEVLSRNIATGKLEYKRVTKLIAPHQDKVLELRVAGEPNGLRPTANHPFFIKHREDGEGHWVNAAALQVGDSVLTAKGTWSAVTAISPIEKEETVYNFEVEEDHDYFVGSVGLLVHNGGPCFPRGFANAEQFAQSMQELRAALGESGVTDASIGVRGSSVTGVSSSTGEAFGAASDIDVFVESGQLTNGLKTSTNIPGFVHPDRIANAFPAIADWSVTWSRILGREISVGGFQPGAGPLGSIIPF